MVLHALQGNRKSVAKTNVKKLFELIMLGVNPRDFKHSEAVKFGIVRACLAVLEAAVARALARRISAGGSGERHFVRAQEWVRVARFAG